MVMPMAGRVAPEWRCQALASTARQIYSAAMSKMEVLAKLPKLALVEASL